MQVILEKRVLLIKSAIVSIVKKPLTRITLCAKLVLTLW
jgi:hypothetical protein